MFIYLTPLIIYSYSLQHFTQITSQKCEHSFILTVSAWIKYCGSHHQPSESHREATNWIPVQIQCLNNLLSFKKFVVKVAILARTRTNNWIRTWKLLQSALRELWLLVDIPNGDWKVNTLRKLCTNMYGKEISITHHSAKAKHF